MEFFESDYEKYDVLEDPKNGSSNSMKQKIDRLRKIIEIAEDRLKRIDEFFIDPKDREGFRQLELERIAKLKKELEMLERKTEDFSTTDLGDVELFEDPGDLELFEPYEDGDTELFDNHGKKL